MGSMWNSFAPGNSIAYGPAPVSVKVDCTLAELGIDPDNLDDVGILSRDIFTARYTEIEMQNRALKEKSCLEELTPIYLTCSSCSARGTANHRKKKLRFVEKNALS